VRYIDPDGREELDPNSEFIQGMERWVRWIEKWAEYTTQDIKNGDVKEVIEDAFEITTGTREPIEAIKKIGMACVPSVQATVQSVILSLGVKNSGKVAALTVSEFDTVSALEAAFLSQLDPSVAKFYQTFAHFLNNGEKYEIIKAFLERFR
jgi:hypothetical protein